MHNLKKAPLTPKRHESSKKDCGWIVNKIGELGMETETIQLPKVTELVTQRAHMDVQVLVADVVAAKVGNATHNLAIL